MGMTCLRLMLRLKASLVFYMELHRETGTVFVETLLDFNTFEDFF